MTPPSLRELFEAALPLDADARSAFVARSVDEPTLRARLLRMLDAADAGQDTGGALPLSPAPSIAAAIGEVDVMPPGSRVGPFELIELIGEGGYATVFRAARENDGVRQEVALKLLRGGMYSPHAQRQFRREHRALAQLRHPNIAGLIEGGVTPSGQAYIALELVDGVPITQYAREHRLDLRARLVLFAQVCRAVDAAHHALIVHRDLKPANVLVTAQGRVQLIDFGVAKLIDADDETQTHAPGFTPAYAAPEQRRGDPITVATDVYALGVVLGELATGQRLNDGSGRTPSSRIAAQADAGVLPASPQASQRLLRGDLDNIVLKAIEPEPARRYPSAAAMADDIEAHLAGRPVAAHPPSQLYRVRKFVARHRGGVMATVAFSAAVFAALGIALWQAQVARSQAQRAGEVQRFMEAMFEPLAAGNDNGAGPSLRELLQRGLQRLDERHPDDPALRAELLAMFARINDGIGEVHANVALTESAWQASIAAWGKDDRRSLDVRALLGRVLRKDGQYRRAHDELESLRRDLQRLGIGGILYAQVIDTQLNARTGFERVPAEEALALRREILRLREADPTATPEDVSTGYNNLGSALEAVRDYPAAIVAYQRAYALRHAALGDSASAALSLSNVGNAQSWMKQWRPAIAVLRDARAMYDRARITAHPGYAGLLTRLCDIGTLLGELDAAAVDCPAAIAMNEAVFGDSHAMFATALTRNGGYALAAGETEAAIAFFERARAVTRGDEGDPGARLQTIDLAEAPRWRLAGDMATLRDRLAPMAANPGSERYWAAPLVYAWLALACDAAPAAACGDDRRAAAERVLADPELADDPLQLPARTALARIDLRHGERASAARELRRAIDAAEQLDARHAWRGEAWWVLSLALDDAGASRDARAQAVAIIQALPPRHALRAAFEAESAAPAR